MRIIEKSSETMEKNTQYFLTKNPDIGKMSELDGVLNVTDWLIFEEADKGETGKTMKILSVHDSQTGMTYATNSETFIGSFKDIVEIFGQSGFEVTVIHGTTKAGRDFINCKFVREV